MGFGVHILFKYIAYGATRQNDKFSTDQQNLDDIYSKKNRLKVEELNEFIIDEKVTEEHKEVILIAFLYANIEALSPDNEDIADISHLNRFLVSLTTSHATPHLNISTGLHRRLTHLYETKVTNHEGKKLFNQTQDDYELMAYSLLVRGPHSSLAKQLTNIVGTLKIENSPMEDSQLVNANTNPSMWSLTSSKAENNILADIDKRAKECTVAIFRPKNDVKKDMVNLYLRLKSITETTRSDKDKFLILTVVIGNAGMEIQKENPTFSPFKIMDLILTAFQPENLELADFMLPIAKAPDLLSYLCDYFVKIQVNSNERFFPENNTSNSIETDTFIYFLNKFQSMEFMILKCNKLIEDESGGGNKNLSICPIINSIYNRIRSTDTSLSNKEAVAIIIKEIDTCKTKPSPKLTKIIFNHLIELFNVNELGITDSKKEETLFFVTDKFKSTEFVIYGLDQIILDKNIPLDDKQVIVQYHINRLHEIVKSKFSATSYFPLGEKGWLDELVGGVIAKSEIKPSANLLSLIFDNLIDLQNECNVRIGIPNKVRDSSLEGDSLLYFASKFLSLKFVIKKLDTFILDENEKNKEIIIQSLLDVFINDTRLKDKGLSSVAAMSQVVKASIFLVPSPKLLSLLFDSVVNRRSPHGGHDSVSNDDKVSVKGDTLRFFAKCSPDTSFLISDIHDFFFDDKVTVVCKKIIFRDILNICRKSLSYIKNDEDLDQLQSLLCDCYLKVQAPSKECRRNDTSGISVRGNTFLSFLKELPSIELFVSAVNKIFEDDNETEHSKERFLGIGISNLISINPTFIDSEISELEMFSKIMIDMLNCRIKPSTQVFEQLERLKLSNTFNVGNAS
jgi:hypothetical protein